MFIYVILPCTRFPIIKLIVSRYGIWVLCKYYQVLLPLYVNNNKVLFKFQQMFVHVGQCQVSYLQIIIFCFSNYLLRWLQKMKFRVVCTEVLAIVSERRKHEDLVDNCSTLVGDQFVQICDWGNQMCLLYIQFNIDCSLSLLHPTCIAWVLVILYQ